MELTQASHQWATRPADERFLSLTDLGDHVSQLRQRSAGKVISTRKIEVRPIEDDASGLCLVGPNGAPVVPTHWAFGQLAQRAGAPASYLRTLPAPLAADCLNVGLLGRDIEDVGVLLRKSEDTQPNVMAAMTGPQYGRVWNDDLVTALRQRFGDGRTGQFRIPGEFGQTVEITKDNTTLYASEQDMFVFMADEENRIELPNRRDGKTGSLARGFFAWNSEVGAATMGIATFLFDYACSNRIVWGANEYREIKVRHTVSGPDRFMREVTPALERYARSSTATTLDTLKAAQQRKIDDVSDFLTRRFTKSQASAIKLAHQDEEGRPIETLWDAVGRRDGRHGRTLCDFTGCVAGMHIANRAKVLICDYADPAEAIDAANRLADAGATGVAVVIGPCPEAQLVA